jgi:hypothetical protein
MAVDRSFDDGPDRISRPHRDTGRRIDEPTVQQEPAEARNRAEYYDALRTAIPEQGDRKDPTTGAATGRAGWDAIDAANRPPLDRLSISAERALHILDGDARGGGHRHGTGRPGKTEFPADWDDAKILGAIRDVARAPAEPPIYQSWNSRWLARGTRDDVEIVAIVAHDGRIWSGWPRPGGPGVARNPEDA